MKCPYCTEEIPDDVIVRKFCQRDLTFFVPIFKQVSALRKHVDCLAAEVREPRLISNEDVGMSEVAPLVAVLSSIFLSGFLTWIDWQEFYGTGTVRDTFIQILAAAAPFFGAFGLGWLRKVSVRASLALGAVAGFLGFSQMMLLYAIGRMDTALYKSSKFSSPIGIFHHAVPTYWVWSLLLYPLSGALLFLSGTRLAARIHTKQNSTLEEDEREGHLNVNTWSIPVATAVGAVVSVVKAVLDVLGRPK
jgi:hypothetical protein